MKNKTFFVYPLHRLLRDPRRLALRFVQAACVCLLLAVLLSLASPVVAAPAGAVLQDPVDRFMQMFQSLASFFIRVAFGLMFIVFAVGSVKDGLGAQVANHFGFAHALSKEMLNLAGGVVIFVLGLLTLTLVNVVIGVVTSNPYDTNVAMPAIPTITFSTPAP